MAMHPSLRSGSKDKQNRSVLKRFERVEILKKKGVWKEEDASFFGLPKVKVLRFKVKKEKSEGTEAAKTGAAAGATAAPAGGAVKAKTPASEAKKKTESKK